MGSEPAHGILIAAEGDVAVLLVLMVPEPGSVGSAFTRRISMDEWDAL